MNAIIALCHFCDHHGPTTIFCTQAFKYTDIELGQSSSQNVHLDCLSSSSSGTLPQFPHVVERHFNPQQQSQLNDTSPSNKSCKACRAFNANFHHYISYDTNNPSKEKICYISQSTPNDSEVFALVRKACLRTLHCEVFEDPIYFDDDKNGSVIGYEFNIKDCEGRGFQRSYSLIIIMKDRIYLQHLWSFLSKQMANIAGNIKQEAEKKFDADMRMLSEGCEMTLGETGKTSASREDFYAKKKLSKQVRGLIELTDDQMIFAKLHMWFTWVLRMSSCQISEEFVHGPLTEDVLVEQEREELNGYKQQQQQQHQRDESNELVFANDAFTPPSTSVNFHSANLPIPPNLSTYDFLLNGLVIDNLRQLIKLFGYDKFHKLAYHTIVGNQVIVRSKYKNLVVSIIKTLRELIPMGCCKSVPYSQEYLKSYECKLLGLSDQVSPFMPNDIDLNDYLFVDIGDNTFDADVHNAAELNLKREFDACECPVGYVVDKRLLNIIVRTNSEVTQDQIPSLLKKIESYLLNNDLSDKSVSSLIKLAKDEWLNKTKVVYKFSQNGTAGTSVHQCGDVNKLFELLKLNKEDELALKYWQAGLSTECKEQIRNS